MDISRGSNRGSWSWSGEGAKRPTFLSSYGCAASLFSMVTSLVGRVELEAAATAGLAKVLLAGVGLAAAIAGAFVPLSAVRRGRPGSRWHAGSASTAHGLGTNL